MKKIFAIIFLSVVIFPGIVSAADTILNPYWGPIVSCVGGAPITGADGKEIPTCTSLCDAFATIQNALRLAITIGLYIVAPAYAVYAGFKIAVSEGSSNKVAVARKMLLEVVIGILIIIVSFTIVNTFMNALAGMLGSKGETSSWLRIDCKRPACGGKIQGTCSDPTQSCVGAGTTQNPYKCQSASAPASGGANCTPACKDTETCKQSGSGVWNCVPKETPVSGTGDCPVTPIPPITDPAALALEAAAPNPVPIWNSGDPASQRNLDRLRIEFDKLKSELGRVDASARETSVYRPLSYQQHFYDIKLRYDALIALNTSNPETFTKCDAIYRSVKFEAESKHGICKFSDEKCVVSPATSNAVHTRGTGIDIKLTGIEYPAINAFMQSKGIKLSWQGLPTDKVHFNLR